MKTFYCYPAKPFLQATFTIVNLRPFCTLRFNFKLLVDNELFWWWLFYWSIEHNCEFIVLNRKIIYQVTSFFMHIVINRWFSKPKSLLLKLGMTHTLKIWLSGHVCTRNSLTLTRVLCYIDRMTTIISFVISLYWAFL